MSAKSKEEPNKYRQLLRSLDDKMIAGVCGGIADYFELDPSLVRLLFLVVTVFGGSGVLVYLVLWLVLPTENSKRVSGDVIHNNVEEMKNVAGKLGTDMKIGQRSSLSFTGVFLILIGLVFVFHYMGFFRFININLLLGSLLMVTGFLLVIRKQNK